MRSRLSEAQDALDRNAEWERSVGIREETPEYLRLNAAVCDLLDQRRRSWPLAVLCVAVVVAAMVTVRVMHPGPLLHAGLALAAAVACVAAVWLLAYRRREL